MNKEAITTETNSIIYHVYQRGNNKEFIFANDEDKEFFLKNLHEYKKNLNFNILAYVIMSNHYHILISPRENSLGKIMHNINNLYSKYYNNKYNRTGHVFEGRYKHKLVENDSYLIWLLRYIHRNPLRAKICSSIREYIWCSDIYYRNNQYGFVDIDFILNTLSPNRSHAIKIYKRFVDDIGDDSNKENDFNITLSNFNGILGQNINNFITEQKNCCRKSLDEILQNATPSTKEYNFIKSGSRQRYLTEFKIKYIKEALYYKWTLQEIGDFINLSKVAVFKLIK